MNVEVKIKEEFGLDRTKPTGSDGETVQAEVYCDKICIRYRVLSRSYSESVEVLIDLCKEKVARGGG